MIPDSPAKRLGGADKGGMCEAEDLARIARSISNDENALCDLIATDAAALEEAQCSIELERYLRAVPGILSRPAVLDAAIDATMQGLINSGVSASEAVETLACNYPNLAEAVRTAGVLREVLLSTGAVRSLAGERELPRLPARIGTPWRPGEPRYEMIELVGSGSQGRVFRGIDRSMSSRDRPAWVAIKLLREFEESEEALFSESAEALRARRIAHPGVVRVLDRGVSPYGAYIVLEFVQGRTLEEYVRARGGRLAPAQAIALMERTTSAVGAAHNAGVVHRDLKPSNILVDDDGECRVTDFGIGAASGEQFNSIAAARGSLGFVAPEQLRRTEDAPDPSADVYALGALLLWALTGEYPNGKDPEEIERQLVLGSPTDWPPARLLAGLDVELRAVLRRAMAVNPAERHPSAAAFGADLERLKRNEPLAWIETPWTRRVVLARRRHRRMFDATAAGMVLLVSVAVLATWLVARANDRTRASELAAKVAAVEAKGAERVAREQASRVQAVQQFTRALQGIVNSSIGNASSNHWLAALAAIEDLVGGGLVDDADLRESISASRIHSLRTRVDEAKAAGMDGHLQTMLLEALLGYSLLVAGDAQGADAVLRPLAARWAATLPAEDPWLRGITAMADVAAMRCGDAGSSRAARAEARLRVEDLSTLPEPFRKVAVEALAHP